MENRQSQNLAPVNANGDDVTTWALPEGAIARLGRGCEPNMTFSRGWTVPRYRNGDGTLVV